jgi:hypothetical protein
MSFEKGDRVRFTRAFLKAVGGIKKLGHLVGTVEEVKCERLVVDWHDGHGSTSMRAANAEKVVRVTCPECNGAGEPGCPTCGGSTPFEVADNE